MFTVIIFQYSEAPTVLDDVVDIEVDGEDITFRGPVSGRTTVNIADVIVELRKNG